MAVGNKILFFDQFAGNKDLYGRDKFSLEYMPKVFAKKSEFIQNLYKTFKQVKNKNDECILLKDRLPYLGKFDYIFMLEGREKIHRRYQKKFIQLSLGWMSSSESKFIRDEGWDTDHPTVCIQPMFNFDIFRTYIYKKIPRYYYPPSFMQQKGSQSQRCILILGQKEKWNDRRVVEIGKDLRKNFSSKKEIHYRPHPGYKPKWGQTNLPSGLAKLGIKKSPYNFSCTRAVLGSMYVVTDSSSGILEAARRNVPFKVYSNFNPYLSQLTEENKDKFFKCLANWHFTAEELKDKDIVDRIYRQLILKHDLSNKSV